MCPFIVLSQSPTVVFLCRLLTLGLQISESFTWAKELQAEHIVARILWIAENTLNPQLIEKVIYDFLSLYNYCAVAK